MREFEVIKIADGLGIGDGSISLSERVEQQEHPHPVEQEIISKVEAVIDSDSILVPIDTDDNGEPIQDDGCGDGRWVKRILRGKKFLKRSLNRAKVFGGGATMGVAAAIGLGKADGHTLFTVFTNAIDTLESHGVHFGAHTDEHAHGSDCGCGAIDKAQLIIGNAVKFRTEITDAIGLLTDKQYDKARLSAVLDNFAIYAPQALGDDTYKGHDVATEITGRHKVIKELGGPHLETHVVINTVQGYTINQEIIREVSDGKAQIFGVDAWRLRQIADKAYDDEESREKAFLSMLVYTLATAATLTKGDLPVFVVNKTPQPEAS